MLSVAAVRPSRRLARRVGTVAAALSVVMLGAGCGLSDDAPRPGVAAEVDGEVLSIDALDALVDGVCVSVAENPDSSATTRQVAERDLLQNWIATTVILTLGEQSGADARGASTDPTTVPGWSAMDDREQDAVEEYLISQNDARATLERIGRTGTVEDVDIEVNPRFDLAVETDADLDTMLNAGFVVADGQLSVAASDEARGGASDDAQAEQPTAAEIARLPQAQICGARPDPAAEPEPMPLG